MRSRTWLKVSLHLQVLEGVINQSGRVIIEMLTSAIANFARDVRAIGLYAALQGARTRSGNGVVQVTIPGVGPVSVRQGDSDYDSLRQIFVRYDYEIGNDTAKHALERRYRAILGEGRIPLIIDAGANIGLAALWYSRFYPDAAIVCVEPDRANFKMLEINTALVKNVRSLHAAIGSSPGKVDIHNDSGLSWASATARSSNGSVPIVTVADIIHSMSNSTILIAKIDIEGFEEDLFSENLGWLDEVCAVFIEPHDYVKPRDRTSRSFQKAFGERSFGLFLRGDMIIYINDRDLIDRD
jgi:FkbM family methyltransferase